MELLEVKNLSKHYKSFDLMDISFTLPRGYIMGYVGPNGSGKTTTLNLITGIVKCSDGEVYIDGHTCKEDVKTYREQIGYVGDESYFPDNFTAKNIRLALKDFYTTFSEEKFNAFLQKWNKKKNHLNSFLKEYEGRYEYRRLTCENRGEIWSFLDKWREENG